MPTPELNPLLNPVLCQNMSRWAEVYFSSAPENRDQAVLELLQELEVENSRRASASDASRSPAQVPARDGAAADALKPAEAAPPTNRCENCGRINPATHRFCGMCGKPVGPQTASPDLHVSDLHIADVHVAGPNENPARRESAPLAASDDSRFIPPAQPSYQQPYQQTPTTDELPLFHSGGGIDYSADHSGVHANNDAGDYDRARDAEILAYAAAPRSYRLYVGLALVTFFLGLAYLAWRTTQTTHVESLSLPPNSAQPSESTEPSVATPTTGATSQPIKPSTQSATVVTPAEKRAARIKARKEARAAARAKAKAAQSPAPSSRAPSSASAAPASTRQGATSGTALGTMPGGGGAEELAMAESYLNGTNGQERNHTEAAKWLWKSVGKHNSDATLALSDLYLKGDGVSKSCDQARILLDAAARKGIQEAGERLRHLPAFGCQ